MRANTARPARAKQKADAGRKSEFVPIAEIVQRLAAAESTVYSHIKNGQLPSIRIGGRWYVPRDKFEAQLRGELDA